MILIALQKVVNTKGNTTQKYSLTKTSISINAIAAIKKATQYLLTDCVSFIGKNFDKYIHLLIISDFESQGELI